MQTEICKKLGIEYPIFAFTHCRDVVVAVSKAGGIGVLGAVGFSLEQLQEELDWIDAHIGDRPYGVDTVIPQKYEGMDQLGLPSAQAYLQGRQCALLRFPASSSLGEYNQLCHLPREQS